jgi:peptide/nickel transport system substrate-binding protein
MSTDQERPIVDQENEPSAFNAEVSRRRALQIAGAGAAVAMAGLTLPGKLVEAATPSAGKVREFHTAWPYLAPPQGHFNQYASDANAILTGGNGIYNDLLQMPMAKYKWGPATWVPWMATSWKLAGATFVVNLRKGAKWSDGTEFTSQDVLTTFNIRRLQALSEWDYLDRVSAPDKYTVTFHMKKEASVIVRYVLEAPITADSTYGVIGRQVASLVSKGKDLANTAEGKVLRQQLDQFRPKGIVCSGPFMFDPSTPITSGQLTLVKNPMSWAAPQVQFDKIVDYNGETPAITPLVLQKQIDYATQGFPVATTKQFASENIHILRPPAYSGPALMINYNKVKALGKKEIRQALAYAVDRDQNALVALGASAKRQLYMTGVSDNILKRWVGAGTLPSFNQYPYNPAKATQIFKAHGYKMGSDGVWVAPDGSKMDYTLEVPQEFSDWSASASNLAEQLTKFGVKTTVRAITYTQVPTDQQQGHFELIIQGWGTGSPFPQFSFFQDLEFPNPPVAAGPGTGFNLTQNGVNLVNLITATGAGFSLENQRVAVAQMARTFNDLLPIIPLFERYGNNVALQGVRVTGWPPDSDPIYQNGFYADSFVTMMIVSGQLKGV